MKTLWFAFASFHSLVAYAGQPTPQQSNIPASCVSTIESDAFLEGLATGVSFVQDAWGAVKKEWGDEPAVICTHVQTDFQDSIMHSLLNYPPPSQESPGSFCRYSGVATGMRDQLDMNLGSCEFIGFAEGRMTGEITGVAYCEIAIAKGGLANTDEFLLGSTQTFGYGFDGECEVRFDNTTKFYTNAKGDCHQYTQDPFDLIASQWRKNLCAAKMRPAERL